MYSSYKYDNLLSCNNITLLIIKGMTGEQEYIKFSVSGKVVPVPTVTAFGSQHVKVLVDNFGIDVIIDIPDKFSLVIDNYINFLQGNEEDMVYSNQYKPCFDMYTYFDDDNYLNYLIGQTVKHWSNVSNIVYNDLIPVIQRQIFLRCSYHVIPKHYLTDVGFYLEWSALNTNVEYQDSNDGHYHNNMPVKGGYFGTYVVYRCLHEVKTNRSKNRDYHDDSDSDDGEELEDEQLEEPVGYGLEVGYYPTSGNIKYICELDHGRVTGKLTKYYDNSQHATKSITYYNSYTKNGTVTAWHDDSQHSIRKTGNYVRDKKDGVWNYWYDPTTSIFGNHTFGSNTLGNHTHENHTHENHTHENHILEKQGKYVRGKREGVWKYWYNDSNHSLQEEGEYYYDRRLRMWTSWYPINDNNVSVVKETGDYIYDKELIKFNEKQNIHDDIKNGVWTQYNEYGTVISHETYHYGQLWKHTDV